MEEENEAKLNEEKKDEEKKEEKEKSPAKEKENSILSFKYYYIVSPQLFIFLRVRIMGVIVNSLYLY